MGGGADAAGSQSPGAPGAGPGRLGRSGRCRCFVFAFAVYWTSEQIWTVIRSRFEASVLKAVVDRSLRAGYGLLSGVSGCLCLTPESRSFAAVASRVASTGRVARCSKRAAGLCAGLARQ